MKNLNIKDTFAVLGGLIVFIFGLGVVWNSVDSRIRENADRYEYLRAEADMRITDLEQDWTRERAGILSDVKQLDQARHQADLERNTLKSDLRHIRDSLDKVIKLLEEQVQLRTNGR